MAEPDGSQLPSTYRPPPPPLPPYTGRGRAAAAGAALVRALVADDTRRLPGFRSFSACGQSKQQRCKNECDHLHGHTSAGGELGKQKRRPDASKRRLQLSYREASMHDFVLVVPVIIVVLVTITHNISATPNQRAGAPI